MTTTVATESRGWSTPRIPGPSASCATCARRSPSSYDVTALAAVHRTGTLDIGDIAVICATATGHRGEAFEATRALIDTLKAEVPIWKHESILRRDRGVGRLPPSAPSCTSGQWDSFPTLSGMEILLWLVPPAVVTVVAMVWVAWLGRAGRGEVDREEAVHRLTKAMQKEHPGHPSPPRPVPQ